MKTVADVLTVKGRTVFSAVADATVYHALTVMAEKNIGALVVGEGERVVGIFWSATTLARWCSRARHQRTRRFAMS